ncbi:hypothetical protein BO78DRAFT_466223 [Aspergillus sclerotiicarbonarius CBS 121057]|uniref:Uncharacterized protein n=1 Tax=Aspergillus sclerotiicarbonarius (strain CBS 121057 / IBT 28362) TaxID=1448318 RepID=A0A319EV38_ASPSB|nr:hypothetical protein BO78DRAFT_466223 [Aspergillus sclerotiicarbonarius CBS 121057]
MSQEHINLSEGDSSELVRVFRLGLTLTDSTGQGSEDVWEIDQDNSKTPLSEYLQYLTDDFCLALESKALREGERLIRTRMDTILFVLLATMKKIDKINSGNDSSSGPGAHNSIAPCWIDEKKDHDMKEPHELKTRVDYILRYGREVELHTNLVVLRMGSNKPDGGWGALAVLASIHRKRKKAGIKADIYGICTDSSKWIFLHVNNNGQYSRLFLDWAESHQKITNHLCHIIRQAMTLAEEVLRLNSPPIFRQILRVGRGKQDRRRNRPVSRRTTGSGGGGIEIQSGYPGGRSRILSLLEIREGNKSLGPGYRRINLERPAARPRTRRGYSRLLPADMASLPESRNRNLMYMYMRSEVAIVNSFYLVAAIGGKTSENGPNLKSQVKRETGRCAAAAANEKRWPPWWLADHVKGRELQSVSHSRSHHIADHPTEDWGWACRIPCTWEADRSRRREAQKQPWTINQTISPWIVAAHGIRRSVTQWCEIYKLYHARDHDDCRIKNVGAENPSLIGGRAGSPEESSDPRRHCIPPDRKKGMDNLL